LIEKSHCTGPPDFHPRHKYFTQSLSFSQGATCGTFLHLKCSFFLVPWNKGLRNIPYFFSWIWAVFKALSKKKLWAMTIHKINMICPSLAGVTRRSAKRHDRSCRRSEFEGVFWSYKIRKPWNGTTWAAWRWQNRW